MPESPRAISSISPHTAGALLVLCLTGSGAGCSSTGRLLESEASISDSRSALRRELYAACLAHHGGLRMDAVGLHGGALSQTCVTWAYRQARKRVP